MSVFGIFDSIANMVNTTNTNNMNKAENERNRRFQKQLIDEQNQWNSYSNQANLMREAGLNPAVMFSNNAVSGLSQSSVNPPGTIPMQSSSFDSGNIGELFLEQKRIQNETARNQVEMEKAAEETKSYQLANSQYLERTKAEIDKIKADKDYTDEHKQLLIKQKETEQAKREELYKNISLLDLEAKARNLEIDKFIKFTPIEYKQLQTTYKLSEEQAKVAAKTIENLDSEIEKRKKEGLQLDAVTMSQILDNVVKDAQVDYKLLEEMIKNDSPMDWILLEHTNGIFQSGVAEINAFLQNRKRNTYEGMKSNAKSRKASYISSSLFGN